LVEDVSERLKWDFIAEFGFTSRVGRTLEKSAAAVAQFRDQDLDSFWQTLLQRLKNEVGELRDLELKNLKIFVYGFLDQMRVSGGFYNSSLKAYIEDLGHYFRLGFFKWMPNFGKRARLPVFLHLGGRSKTFQKLYAPLGSQRTWPMLWAEKIFMGEAVSAKARVPEILEKTVSELVRHGIVKETESRDAKIWSLKTDNFEIVTDVSQVRCNECHHLHYVSSNVLPVWEGAACMRRGCPGDYSPETVTSSYYKKLYSTGDIQRIFAAEHTGLLERDEREQLERDFKSSNPLPWSPNLLSSTPTLEMGIDIGDLSSLILCSVPPAQANYLQRIGRAGRRDGNSLNITIANARPHDLYFFADPTEMIAGKIESPGIFLDASEVLKRQYLAFSFDHWASSGVPATAIPNRLIKALNVVEASDTTKFPYTYLDHISQYQSEILEKFKNMFIEDLSPEALDKIEAFSGDQDSNPIPYDILTRLQGMVRERESLKAKLQSATRQLREKERQELRDQNYNEELDELRMEKDALHGLIKKIDNKDTLQFFTDEGLLPNYAFPEAGVVLKSIIFKKRRNPQPGEGNYESKVYEYERASASAIRELAPLNEFYAGGRHVEINRVDLAVSDIEDWRLCQSCSYSEAIALGDDKPVCPRCGDEMWRDEGQKQSFLRMRQVFANRLDRDSRISDDADQRDPKFYNEQILVDFDPRDVISAYKVDEGDLAFGYEFVRRIKLKEVNFGESSGFSQERRFAGVTMERPGFTLCKGCGAVKKANGEIEHAFTCNQKKKSQDDVETKCVYLYREFDSEAMRILLPATSIALDDKALQSFIAGIHLGLKLKFGGDIQHLESTVQQAPIEGTNYSKKVLVIYDRIPGGTGYLKQLTKDSSALMEVLELALNHLKSCHCATDADTDGCYRCIYAYRHSHRMADTSRNEAILLFSKILEKKNEIVTTKSIDDVDVSSLLDSELEVRFIKSLEKITAIEGPKVVKHHIVNGKPGWMLSIGEGDKRQSYSIEPQVRIGEEHGVAVRSKVDFLIRPLRTSPIMKPIVVFTDGLTYHRDRLGKDTAQRLALLQSGKFNVWSIPWWDVESVYSDQGDYCANYLLPSRALKGDVFSNFIVGFSAPIELNRLHERSSLEMLMKYLSAPDENGWRKMAGIYGAIHCSAEVFASSGERSELFNLVETMLPSQFSTAITGLSSGLWGLFKDDASIRDIVSLSKAVAIDSTTFKTLSADCVRVVIHLDDRPETLQAARFRNVWAGFLKLLNLYQFLPHFYFTTQTGIESDVYKAIQPLGHHPGATEVNVDGSELEEIKELLSEDVFEMLKVILGYGAAIPVVGYEFENQKGVVLGEAELAWPDKKIAFVYSSYWNELNSFQEKGWKLFKMEEVLSSPEKVRSLFEKGSVDE
jgi:DEAD/DEAH box helicase domain-containing protein